MRTLKRIGGEALTHVAHCWLRDGRTFWSLQEASQLAVLRPSEPTAELFLEVALREEVEGSDHPFGQLAAIRALLTIGRTDLAVRGVMKWGVKLSWEDIELFAAYRPTASDLQPALEAVQEGERPDPNIVLAIGLGGREQDVPAIHKILRTAPPGSELSRTCLLALYIMKDRSDETTSAFLDHLASPQAEYVATLGLLQVRTPQALAELKTRMVGLNKEHLSSSDNAILIAVNLLEIDDTRREVAAMLWGELDQHRILFIVQDDLSAFADLERSDVDDWLYDLALGEGYRHMNFGNQIGAIRAVATRDKARAFDAALRLTELDASNQEDIPKLLFDIDPERAIPWLHGRLAQEDEVIMLTAIGESLYAAGQGSTLLDWLQDPSPRVRESACISAEVFAWDDDLARTLRTLLYDSDWYVRNAANQALDRLWHAREIDRLVDALLEEVDATRRWCLLDIVVEGGHPGLWQRQPWITKLWEQLPFVLQQRAAEFLKKRRKEVRDELKKRKRRDA